MIDIDGSVGEGGGQMLRTGLTLGMLSGQPVSWRNIRARRDPPGLRPQHLECVRAAVAVCGAKVVGAELGSRTLTFEPGPVVPGEYRFEIPTAGCVGLVLHTVHAALALAGKPSVAAIRGGTHVDFAPSADYLSEAWAPALSALGFGVKLRTETLGFYPRGGGWLHVEIAPHRQPAAPIQWLRRAPLEEVRVLIATSGLPPKIAQRLSECTLARLRKTVAPEVAVPPPTVFDAASPGPGCAIALACRFGDRRGCFQAIGSRNRSSEQVADDAVGALSAFLDGDAPIDEHLADQLLLPLAAAGLAAEYRTPCVTQHLLTNAAVIGQFLAAPRIDGALGKPGTVSVG